MKLDYYDILGLSRAAKANEITEAYKQLAEQWHPANNPGYEARAEKRFRRISEAYQILSDHKRRYHYKKALKKAAKPFVKKPGSSMQLLNEECAGPVQVEKARSESSSSLSSVLSESGSKAAEEPVVLGHKYAHAQPKGLPDETALGKNLMIQQVGGNTVTCFPETLLSLRNPYRVYNEVVGGAKPNKSPWTYCEQLVEWHIASMAKLTDVLDVFGNKTVITTIDYTDGMKNIKVKRNGKLVQNFSVSVKPEDWQEEERETKRGAGHIIIIDEAPDPPPGMRRLPRDP
ncbi:hypothetical protein BOX15_Mlig000041g5 [Macrostomum lignano]|nr:hypothetical protein BOX15_Mlig000041g5 [Macrostomum lignano]